jgi:hypothetical protein
MIVSIRLLSRAASLAIAFFPFQIIKPWFILPNVKDPKQWWGQAYVGGYLVGAALIPVKKAF